MERWITGTTVIFVWAIFNTLLSSILAGFTASGFIGGAGAAGVLAYGTYAVSTAVVFTVGLLVWLGRRRRRGLRVPLRPGAALLLAVAVALAWLGLAFGIWLAIVGATVAFATIILEIYPRASPSSSRGRP
jgi:hypothetical protein